MPKFRKKPVVIEAMRWNVEAMIDDATDATTHAFFDWIGADAHMVECQDERLLITTLEGNIYAEPGDWIIRGVKGELYPCKPDIFEATYEPVTEAMEAK